MTDGSIKIDNIRGKVSGISYGSSGSLSADVINIQGNLTIVINNPTQEVISDLKRIQQVPLQIVDTSTTSNTTQDSKETRQSIELFKKLLLKGDDKTGTPMHSIKAGNVEISRDELLTKDAGTMAYEYIMRGDYNNGLEWLNKAIQIDPNNATTWYNKGVALERLGRYTEAIQSYDTALQFYPFYGNAWEGKAFVLNELGRYTEAIQCIDRALRVNPNNAKTWQRKGWTLEKLGRYTEAKQYYERARQMGYKG